MSQITVRTPLTRSTLSLTSVAAGPDAGLVRWRTSSRVVEGRLQRQLLYTATSRGASAPAGACKATKRGGRVTVSSPGRCHGRVNVSFPCHGSGPFSLIAEAQMPDSFARAAPALAHMHGQHAGYDSGTAPGLSTVGNAQEMLPGARLCKTEPRTSGRSNGLLESLAKRSSLGSTCLASLWGHGRTWMDCNSQK